MTDLISKPIGRINPEPPQPIMVGAFFPPLVERMSSGTKGAISELVACAYLMRKAYHVFRCESPNAPFDLFAYKDGTALRVEVKTMGGYRNAREVPGFPLPSNLEWDLLLVVGDYEIVELPNDGDLAMTRERFRAYMTNQEV
jgi:hypothetical protein